jgi:hypothetical protein
MFEEKTANTDMKNPTIQMRVCALNKSPKDLIQVTAGWGITCFQQAVRRM